MSVALDMFFVFHTVLPVPDNFTCKLFGLLSTADSNNFKRLQAVYPVEARMVEIYQNQEIPEKSNDKKYFEQIEELARKTARISSEYALEFVVGNV